MTKKCMLGVKTITKTERSLDTTANKMCCADMAKLVDGWLRIDPETMEISIRMHSRGGGWGDSKISHCPFCGAEIIFVNTSPMTLEDLHQPGIQPQGTYTWSDDNRDISTEENEDEPR